ncbi:MAG: hypothetical protein JW791_04865, partial [Nanoarchaeota archaeon]|nr:hypothetical protein [Nanoarchaeota archaeon]
MNVFDVFKPRKENLDLEKIANTYEVKDKVTPIKIEGKTYILKISEYENLIQILTETETKLEEIREYTDQYQSSKYFGVRI